MPTIDQSVYCGSYVEAALSNRLEFDGQNRAYYIDRFNRVDLNAVACRSFSRSSRMVRCMVRWPAMIEAYRRRALSSVIVHRIILKSAV